jgi:hypothetical protein
MVQFWYNTPLCLLRVRGRRSTFGRLERSSENILVDNIAISVNFLRLFLEPIIEEYIQTRGTNSPSDPHCHLFVSRWIVPADIRHDRLKYTIHRLPLGHLRFYPWDLTWCSGSSGRHFDAHLFQQKIHPISGA